MSKPKMIATRVSPCGTVIIYPDDGGRAVLWALAILLFSAALVVVPFALFALLVFISL